MPFLNPALKNIDEKEILRYAGMRGEDAGVQSVLVTAIREALLYCQPKGVWEVYKYEKDTLLYGSDSYSPGSKRLCDHLQGSLMVVMMAVTVGEAVEKRIEELFASGEYTKAVLLDAAATTAVEQVADKVCMFIGDSMKKQGLSSGMRFSPGYGDWDIKQQPKVIELSGAAKIGISATKSFMLMPRKSVTAALGLKPFSAKAAEFENCAACDKIDCQLRRKN